MNFRIFFSKIMKIHLISDKMTPISAQWNQWNILKLNSKVETPNLHFLSKFCCCFENLKFVLINFDKKWKFGVSTLESNLRVFHWFHWADIGVIVSEIKWIFRIMLKNMLKLIINGWKLQFFEKLLNFENWQKSEKMQKVSDLRPWPNSS